MAVTHHRGARGDLAASAVLGLLGARGPLSRADIARVLGISAASVTQVTRGLIARGLVAELDEGSSRGGRPARPLTLVRSAGSAIGVKVTADHVVLVEVGLDGAVTALDSRPYDAAAPDALDRLGHLLAESIAAHRGHLLGVGVGIPGSVDTQASGVVSAPTLGWVEAQVGPILRAALGVPVLVENDVNTLAVAEQLYGRGREYGSYMVVTIGRGVGCGIVVDGELYRGALGGAGEIGHIPVSDDGPRCGCGSTGCLEAYAGEQGLIALARSRGVLEPDGDIADLLAAARAGDQGAGDIYAEAGAILGRALAGIVHTIDPEVVVLLGEGIDAWPFWERGFEPSFRRHLLPARRGLPFVIEAWTEEKWAQGAASLVLASPFDAAGAGGDQGEQVRRRLHASAGAGSPA